MGFFWPQHDPPTQTRLPSSWHQQAATYAEIRCLQWQLAIALLVSMCLFDCVNWCPSLIFVLSHRFFQLLTINFTIHFPTFPTFAQLFQHLPTVPTFANCSNIYQTFTIHFPYISHIISLSPETGAPAPVSGSWPVPAANPRGWPTGTNDSPPEKMGWSQEIQGISQGKLWKNMGNFENTWILGMNFLSIVSWPKNYW